MAIAIVGIGCRFPGGIADPASFWRVLRDGVDAIAEIPPNRIDVERYYDRRPATPGRMASRLGGFLDRIDEFDAAFFGISPREAATLDPQQRLLLETAWEALEDAGQDVRGLDGTDTGVFVGQWTSDFEARMFADVDGLDFPTTTGSGRYAASGRLSFALGLRGPSLTIDTACSSSLVAVHLAVQSLRSGEATLALAGGVNVILQPHITVAYSQSGMMAADGRCKFGAETGDGYVRSEGAALVVLKTLDRAAADGDRIYAVIRGSAVNNDGRSSGSMGTPSRHGQEALLRAAYRNAGVAPGAVGYIEAHGTGTRAGDPVELSALATVLGEGRSPSHRARVGSFKSNVGHTEGAAGVAGLIKVALSLHHRTIAPSLHWEPLTTAVSWSDMPFTIARTGEAWMAEDASRIGGVSAFGIAGTNAHVVLEEAPAVAAVPPPSSTGALLLPLSARHPAALRALAGRYAELLLTPAGPALADVCWSAATLRTKLDRRAAFVASDQEGMAVALRSYADGDAATAEGTVYDAARPRVAFVCPGQGGQWLTMARELMAREPVFLAAIEHCDAAARPYLNLSLRAQLLAAPGADLAALERIAIVQPMLVAMAIGYAALWRSLGVEPDAVVGHSMGEVSAACIAGVLSIDDAMRIVCRRSALMGQTSGQGAMALVDLSMADTEARIRSVAPRLAVAASNSPRSSVISGDPEAVHLVMASLERDGVFCRLVKVDVASHSPQMDPVAKALRAELIGLAPSAATTAIYSTVSGRRQEGAVFDASYWAANVRQPVRFAEAVQQLAADGVRVFIELGPHPILLPAIQHTMQSLGLEATTLGSGRRDEPGHIEFRRALAALFCSGYELDWRRVMPDGGRRVTLPSYPWQRERHWPAAAELRRGIPAATAVAARPDDESLGWLQQLTWTPLPPAPAVEAKAESWLVVARDVAHGEIFAAALRRNGASAAAAAFQDFAALVAASAVAHVLVLAPDTDDVAFLPVATLQALGPDESARPRLWFATCGAQAVGAPLPVAVMQAALWGSARVVAEEHPHLWGGLIDLDPAADPVAQATALSTHLAAPGDEDQVALRGGDRLGLRLRAMACPDAAPLLLRADAAYLVTGGLGDIGLAVAQSLVRRGARRVVLLGRTALPARDQWMALDPTSAPGRRVAAVRGLEAMGATVHLAAVDVASETQLAEFLAGYRREAWPAICGVFHAAGTFDNRLAGTMDLATFESVLAPKLRGAQLLDRLLPDLDLFVLFSSTGAFMAQAGQANYAAANAGLDALAVNRRADGRPAQSIAWGVWNDTGLVRNAAGHRSVAEMHRQGIQAFSAAQGLALFEWLCGNADVATVVLPIDWARFARSRAGRPNALFRGRLAGTVDTASRTAVAAASTSTPADRRRIIDGAVREAVGTVLRIAPARLDARKTFGSLGLSSLLAMELRNRLEVSLGRPLSATLAWNHPTVDALVAHLSETSTAPPATAPPPTAAPVGPVAAVPSLSARLTDLATLSDDDAALALRKRRPRS